MTVGSQANDGVDCAQLDALDARVLGSLREALERAGYDAALIAKVERVVPGQLDVLRRPLVLHALAQFDGPSSVYARLFCYQDCVGYGELVAHLGVPLANALLAGGLLTRDEAGVRARVLLMPFYGVFIASDELHCPDPAMGPGATTHLLARSLPLDGTSSLLDVGTGAGSLALVAKRRGVARVVGVDVSPRALAFARFNGRLNGLDVEWLEGDLTGPVSGQHFDAVVAQPPFVPRPDALANSTFLHGGRRGDELALRLLGELEPVLSGRGRALLLVEAPLVANEPVQQRFRAALGGAALNLLGVVGPGHPADRLALGYAALADPGLGQLYAQLARRYRGHLDELGVAETKLVILHLERASRAERGEAPSGKSYTVFLEVGDFGGYDAAGLDALRAAMVTVSLPDTELLDQRLRPAQGARMVQDQSMNDPDDLKVVVRFDGGRGVQQSLSDTAALLLTLVRDFGLLSQVVKAYAEEVGRECADVEPEVLAFLRRGLVMGLFETV